MNGRHCAILGAGPAGLAAANALLNAGWQVSVFDKRHPVQNTEGAFLLWPNGKQSLSQMGLDCRKLYSDTLSTTAFDFDGNKIGEFAFDRFFRHLGTGISMISRSDLMACLALRLPLTCLRFGTSAIAVQPGPCKTRVIFTHGETKCYDLVVIADGIDSSLRQMLFPQSTLVDLPQLAITGMLSTPLDGASRHSFQEFFGRGKSVLISRDAQRRTIFKLKAHVGDPFSREELQSQPAITGFAASLLAQTPIPELIGLRDALMDDLVQWVGACKERSLAPLPQWQRGTTILIGDAAHAMTSSLGQGLNQALEDAEALGRVLGGPEPVQEALNTFQSFRMHRTRLMTNLSLSHSLMLDSGTDRSGLAAARKQNLCFPKRFLDEISGMVVGQLRWLGEDIANSTSGTGFADRRFA